MTSDIPSKVNRKEIVDPRFKRPSRKKTKILVDERFGAMFTDSDFVSPVTVDKYGRPLTSDSHQTEMARLYAISDDSITKEVMDGKEKDTLNKKTMSISKSIRGEMELSFSEGEDDLEDDVDAPMDEVLSSHPLVQNEQVRLVSSATHRLALVNADWDQLKATDIYTMLHAFKSPTGQIISVTIYPSEIGKMRLKQESLEGPPKNLFISESNRADDLDQKNGEDHEHEDQPTNSPPHTNKSLSLPAAIHVDTKDDITRDESDDDLENSIAVKRYQLERLRFFYAVVICDSAETAQHIYSHCDGSEFETSSNFLDLRFIPDDTIFDDADAYDQCDALPTVYRSRHDIVSQALQMTRTKLSWESEDPERARITRARTVIYEAASNKKKKKNGVRDVEEADLRAYLASGSDSDNSVSKYRELLGGQKSAFSRGQENEDSDVDCEMTFDMEEGKEIGSDSTSNVAQVSANSVRTKPRNHESTNEFGQKKEKNSSSKNKKTKIDRKGKKIDYKEQDRLQLLIRPEDGIEDEDRTAGPRKYKKRNVSDTSVLDLTDSRFNALIETPEFALDPTHPAYKKTAASGLIMRERLKRSKAN